MRFFSYASSQLEGFWGASWIAGLCFLWDFSFNTGLHVHPGALAQLGHQVALWSFTSARGARAGQAAQACPASSAQPALRYFLIYKAPFLRQIPGRSRFRESITQQGERPRQGVRWSDGRAQVDIWKEICWTQGAQRLGPGQQGVGQPRGQPCPS